MGDFIIPLFKHGFLLTYEGFIELKKTNTFFTLKHIRNFNIKEINVLKRNMKKPWFFKFSQLYYLDEEINIEILFVGDFEKWVGTRS